MNFSLRSIIVAVIIVVFTFSADAQKTSVVIPYSISPKIKEASDIVEILVDEYDLPINYSPSQIENIQVPFSFQYQYQSLESLFKDLFQYYNFQFFSLKGKYILSIDGPKYVKISGYIIDSESSEPISNVIIESADEDHFFFSNDNGYYSISTNSDTMSFYIRSLGYKNIKLNTKNILQNKNVIKLKFDNELAPVLISDKTDENYLVENFAKQIQLDKMENNTTIFGEEDIINTLKSLPSVSSGGEGQSGLFVRGTSPDYNLILMDGIPMYETNHIVGLSSIFQDNAVRNVQYMKAGMPARYAGRLSSVVNIMMKDGTLEKNKSEISTGIYGINLTTEGPIKKNEISYNFALRKSWINYLVDNTIEKYNKDINIDISYFDVYGKLSWKLSPSSKLSLSVYSGNDNLEVDRFINPTNTQSVDITQNDNQLKWGTTTGVLNYSTIINQKTYLSSTLGIIRYKAQTLNRFTLSKVNELDSLITETFTNTDIVDVPFKFNIDRYIGEKTRLSIGAASTFHVFKPSILQILDQQSTNNVDQKSYKSIESGIYFEFRHNFSRRLYIKAGSHFSSYKTENKTYSGWQPRLTLQYIPHENHMMAASFCKMQQYVHLLVNPGIGLPSDLWIPSTDEIEPQESYQYDLFYHYTRPSGWNYTIEAYIKQIYNIPELTVHTDFFTNILLDQNIVPQFVETDTWTTLLDKGDGYNKGIELSINKDKGDWKGAFSLSFSRATRTFKNINSGVTFRYKYDRPIDINLVLSKNLNTKLSFGINWTYVSGNTFSLPGTEFQSIINGVTLITSESRNNYRLPPFHQLSINGNYKFEINKLPAKLNFGIYNIYNRKNPYYVYFIKDNQNNTIRGRKVSLFPILPFVNFTIQFE